MKKMLNIIILLLLVFPTSLIGIPSARAVEIPDNWIIEGDTVYVDDTKVYIAVTPHTLDSSGYIYLNVTSKVFNGLADLLFGFESDYFTPRSLEVFTANGTWLNLANKLDFRKVLNDYGGMNTWFITSANVVKNKEYYLRLFIEIKPWLVNDIETHKYFIGLKPSSETFSEALDNNHLYVLDPWLSGGWSQRINMTVASSDIDTTLTNFSFLIHISSNSGINNADLSPIFDELGELKFKIAVTSSDGTTQLFVEVESWNATSEKAYLWVKAPTISNTSDQVFFIYYDVDLANNTAWVGIPGSVTAESVWDDNYVAVLHLSESSGTFLDSTSNKNNASAQGDGVVRSIQKIDGGVDLDGTNDYVRIDSNGLIDGLNAATIEAWVNMDALLSDRGIINDWGGGEDTVLLQYDNAPDSKWRVIFRDTGDTDPATTFGTADPSGAWFHVVGKYVRNDFGYGYENGVETVGAASGDAPLTSPGNLMFIGINRDLTADLNGSIDEVRISSTSRSQVWINATYESGNDNFLRFGAEQNVAPNAPTLDFPVANGEVGINTSVNFQWTYNSNASPSSQSAFEFELYNSSDNSIITDTGKVVDTDENFTLTVPSIEVITFWRVRTWSDLDFVGDWSSNRTLSVLSTFTISVTITNIEGGNYIFASNVYLFEAVYIGGNDTFKVAFDDGITFINMSYNRPSLSFKLDSGSGKADLLTVVFSESGNTQTVIFRVFILDTISDVLDRDIHLWVNNTDGSFAGWDERRTDFLNIYNQGGLTESTLLGDAGLVAGGNIFSIAAQNSTLGSFGRVNVTWRKFQHLSMLVHVFQANEWDTDHWNCPTEHNQTATISYGVDYSSNGGFTEGWRVDIFVVSGSAGTFGVGTDNAYMRLNVTWYNRGSSVKSDILYAWYEAFRITDVNTQFALWIDLWVDIAEGSSTVGGRVNPVFFGMTESGWGPWSSWGPVNASQSVSLFHDDLLDETNAVLSSGQVGLWNVWASLNKTAQGALTPSDDAHQWALIDYDVFAWSVLGVTQTMIGIDTPPPNLPRTPDIGAPGLFSGITLAIALMTKQIVNAILQGATITSFAIATIINSAFEFFNIDNFMGLMTNSLQGLAVRFQLAITNVTSLILTVYNFISATVTWFGLSLSIIVSFWVTLGTTITTIMDGTYGGQGVNWWTLLNWNLIVSTGFLPLIITLVWVDAIDKRSKVQGGNWITIMYGDATILLGLTSFFIDMFFTLINFLISSIFNIMNALDIAARRIFGG